MYPHVLRNVRVLDKKTVLGDPQVQSAIEKVKDTLGDTGRILVRESGTEPVIRVMVEAKDEDLCRQYVQDVMDVIHSQGYAVEK